MDDVWVLSHPGHRRFHLFAQALGERGGRARLLPWSEVLDHAERGTWPDVPPGAVVRVDSPGEDTGVGARLRALGGWQEPLGFGEIGGWAEHARGLDSAVRHLERAPGGVRLDTAPDDVAALFDKRETRARLVAAGVPVPGEGPSADGVCTVPGRWFVKIAHGSSGSGVLALTVGRGRCEAWAPLELVDGVPHNDFALRRYRDTDATALVAALAARGPLHVERWFPKATLGSDALDLRVVVVDGTARNVVVRGSAGPITNLHLGNRRLDVAAVRARAGAAWQDWMEVARTAAEAFPATRCVGVDVLVGSDWSRCVVAEVNAFGDLLPGALHDGRSTYEWQVA